MAVSIIQSSQPRELLTRKEAAKYLGMKEQTLAKWASTQRYDLPFIKVGKSVRYRLADLNDFLQRNTR
ncbi:MAG: helix-turn-helix domain-containing protein [Betaproteobacteria bacterium]|nr:helix-turn-helix domain-containing protein [Betaproteobacteria bacterium]